MGNLNSVARKLTNLNVDSTISSNPTDIINADKLILPGVGHFHKAMQNIRDLNLEDALNEFALVKKKPILGICLGMQLMAKTSEEGINGDTQGLGWFDAEVVRFDVNDTLKYKIPHIGWNTVSISKESALMKDLPQDTSFYFVHTYHIKMRQQIDILNETEYGYKFTSAIEKDNIFGAQYHPEKSHDAGNQFFKNFISI